MPTLVIVRRPRTARSVTQTVRMRFLVGTTVTLPTLRIALKRELKINTTTSKRKAA